MPIAPPNTNPVNVPTVKKSYSFVLCRVHVNTLQMVGMAVRAPPLLDFANVRYIQVSFLIFINIIVIITKEVCRDANSCFYKTSQRYIMISLFSFLQRLIKLKSADFITSFSSSVGL
jgi:hypothetical protein